MKDLERPVRGSAIERRDFIKVGAGAGAMMTMLNADTALPQDQPWWETRPSKAAGARPIAIDVHAHWAPEAYTRVLAELGHPIANPYPLDFDLDKRRKWMDEHGVLMHALTLSGAMPWQWASPEAGARLAQVINDAAVEAHTAFPERFIAGIEMPVRDPALALKELNRIAGKPGMRAVHLPESVERHDYLFEPAFAPIFARSQELGYPLLFHPLDGVVNAYGGNRLVGPPGLTGALDFSFEHAVIASKFITSGTLDKFPRLEIVLPHAGGAFPYLAGRVEHFLYHMGGYDPAVSRELRPQVKLARPFKEYLRRFHYDYLTYYPEGLRFLISLVGSDRIVLGTDNFAAKDIEYPAAVLDQFNLPAADRDRILRGNAMRLFRL
jgi:aminocarboxymuconate-semialdehyde decarboxylase